MAGIRVKDHEPFEAAMRRFKRSVEKSGILAEVRGRQFYEKPSTKRQRQRAAAIKRTRKKNNREPHSFSNDRTRS
jgi:small subunit ribosomal protein S21